MNKLKLLSLISSISGILFILAGLFIADPANINSLSTEEFNIKNLSTSANSIIVNKNKDKNDLSINMLDSSISMNVAESGVYREEVYDGLTEDELSNKLNGVLGGSLSGQGSLITSTCLQYGIDPYMTTAIMLLETGNGTSRISNACNNFGGQKGSGCGSYKAFSTKEEGIVGMITNLYNNFYSKGLNTVESIGPRYAESDQWPFKVNNYIAKIRNS